jgi:hypothetical protein
MCDPERQICRELRMPFIIFPYAISHYYYDFETLLRKNKSQPNTDRNILLSFSPEEEVIQVFKQSQLAT